MGVTKKINMNAQQLAVLVLVCVLGPALIASYVPIYKDQVSKRHDYWLGVSSSTQSLFYIFWGLAAVGFTTYALSLLVQPLNDTRGLFSYGQWLQHVLIIGWDSVFIHKVLSILNLF